MKKIIVWILSLLIIWYTTYTYWSSVITAIEANWNYEKVTILSWEASVVSFPRQIENITFSKDSGFSIRTLEGWVWRDMTNNVSDYNPLNWYLIRNITAWDLLITATYKDISLVENTLFQKSLQAGWNLIWTAYKDDNNWVVSSNSALWEELPYSQVLDFTWNGFVYSWETVINTNHNVDNQNYDIKTKTEISSYSLIEKLAYGLFVNVDSVISGSQKLSDIEFTEEIIPACTEVALLLWQCEIVDATSIDSASDSLKNNSINAELGQLRLVNNSSGTLILQDLWINIVTTWSWVLEMLENVEFEMNWSVYDLASPFWALTTETNLLFNEVLLELQLPVGTSIITFRADTLDNLTDNNTISLSLDSDPLNNNTFNNLNIEYSSTSNIVTDIAPLTFTWATQTITNSSATISNVPLVNTNEIKWTSDVLALQFEIQAGAASDITADSMTVNFDASWTGATSNELFDVSIYKGTIIAPENLLDIVTATNLVAGNVTFNWFNTTILSDTSETFVILTTIADNINSVWKTITASMNSSDVSLQDDQNDIVTLNSLNLSDKVITITDSGQLSLTADSNNIDNQNHKQILAWNESIIYSTDVIATNEAVNVENIYFTLDNNNLKNVIGSAKLYLDDTVVATASNSDVDSYGTWVIAFTNISNLDIPTVSSELRLAIVTETIGYEKVWVSVSNVSVTKVVFNNVNGVESSSPVAVADLNTTGSNTFDVVPTVIVASVTQSLSTGIAKVNLIVDSGLNTATGSAASPVVTIQWLWVIDLITWTNVANFNIFEDWEITPLTEGSMNIAVSGSQIFNLVPINTTAVTYTLNLPVDWITYDAGESAWLSSNLNAVLDLGTKTYE